MKPYAVKPDDPRAFTWRDGRKALAGSGGEADEAKPLSFVMSTDHVDRMGDSIDQKGWRLEGFKKNPTALFAHDSREVIGDWHNVRVEGRKLLGDLRLATPDTSPLVATIHKLIEQKMLRGASVGFIPVKVEERKGEPLGGVVFREAELLECSLVSVPANPRALQIAKAFGLSSSDRDRLFAGSGVVARSQSAGSGVALPQSKGRPMSLADRIKDAQELKIKLSDQLAPLARKVETDGELADDEQELFDTLNADLAKCEKQLKTFRDSEALISGRAAGESGHQGGLPAGRNDGQQPGAPPIIQYRSNGLPRGVKRPSDRLASLSVIRLEAMLWNVPLETACARRYPERDDLAAIIKAQTNPAMTTQAGWAAELVQTSFGDFIDELQATSLYPVLSANGRRHSFGTSGSITLPRRNVVDMAPGDLRAAWVGEGAPIPVRRGSFGSVILSRKKMGVISTATKEMLRSSSQSIEQIIRNGIINDTADTIDTTLLDNLPAAPNRPAGLLNGVTPIAGAAGGGPDAAEADILAILGPFIAANAMTGLRFLLNPAIPIKLGMLSNAVGGKPFENVLTTNTLYGIPFSTSTRVPLTSLVLIREADFTSGADDQPEWEISDVATIHEDDGTYAADQTATQPTTTVKPIVDAAAAVAKPVRSLFQTHSTGIKMVMWMDWTMLRTGMVQTVTGITW
jgi:HK97 family phage prohead protease/HK97 family phage major capsid protein